MKLKRVAVVGPAGSGRSFLINSLLGSKHVEHAVRASPVTLDISSHRDVVEVNGRRAVLELVDTPGFCGQGVILEEVQRDLKTKFKHIDKAVIVIAKGRLEPTEKNEIRSVLQFLDYKNNPEKIMIVINDRREKGINQQQKENDLSNVLHMLGVEDYSIVNSKTQMPHLLPAVSLSNNEEGIFHSEIEMIQEFLLKETTTQDPIIQVRNSVVMTSRNVFSAQSMALLVLAAALVFGFLLNSYMDASVDNYIEQLKTGNFKLEGVAVSQKSYIEQLETYLIKLNEEAVSDKKHIATLETHITKLKEEADSNNISIEKLTMEKINLVDKDSSNKKQISTLETETGKIKEEAESNTKIILTLETDLTELKEEADPNNISIKKLTTDKRNLEHEDASNKKQISTLETDIGTFKGQTSSDRNHIGELNTKYAELCQNYTEQLKIQNTKIGSDLFICQNHTEELEMALFVLAALLIVTASVSVVTSEIRPLLGSYDDMLPNLIISYVSIGHFWAKIVSGVLHFFDPSDDPEQPSGVDIVI
eukprot:GFUD01001071.1.p1 GENE.GFUD01001071.1~~GFUD01001071.1.p1  ORF type:complete len:534 (-),score=130.55 GFUD01001071.1:65-1666(-)